jgi:hypothetical protein
MGTNILSEKTKFKKIIMAPCLSNHCDGVPQVILKVFIIMLYENVFQNPELFPTQVSLYPEHSTLYWAYNIC